SPIRALGLPARRWNDADGQDTAHTDAGDCLPRKRADGWYAGDPAAWLAIGPARLGQRCATTRRRRMPCSGPVAARVRRLAVPRSIDAAVRPAGGTRCR